MRQPGPEDDLGPAIEELLHRLRPRIKRLLCLYNVPSNDAEDVIQEALIAAFRKWDSIQNKEAWLLGTVRNRCMLYWKHRWRERSEAMDPQDLEAASTPLPPPQEREEMLWDLEVIAETLGERHWAMLCLRYGMGLSIPEVARRLGYNPSSIRKLSCRVLNRLHRQMAVHLEPPAASRKD